MIKKLHFLLLSCSILLFFSCNKDDEGSSSSNNNNISFDAVVPATPYMKADQIAISQNGKYMLVQQGNSNSSVYYSNDYGETFQQYNGNTMSSVDVSVNEKTFIANNGLFLNDGIVGSIAVNPEAYYISYYSAYYEFFLTESGRIISFQQNRTTNDYEIYESTTESTFIIDTATFFSSNFIGSSGDVLYFFESDSKTLLWYDVSTKTSNEKTYADLDLTKLNSYYGYTSNRYLVKYHNGYLAIAKELGCAIIDPNDQITYYSYPEGTNLNIGTVGIALNNGEAYITKVATYHAKDGALNQSEYKYPVAITSDATYYNGFIENGSRPVAGFVRNRGGNEEYIGGELTTFFSSGYYYMVGGDVYLEESKYNTATSTYSSFDIEGRISSVLHKSGSSYIAYSDSGTYSTTNSGQTWIKENVTVSPDYVSRAKDGSFYGMDVSIRSATIVSGNYVNDFFTHKTYTSTDGLNWNFVNGSNNKEYFLGYGNAPTRISAYGEIQYSENDYSLGNAIIKTFKSTDVGVTYMQVADEDFTPVEVHYTSSGKSVYIPNSTSNSFDLKVCSNKHEGCVTSTITLPTGGNARDIKFDDEDYIWITGSDAIYRSNEPVR